MMHLPTFLELYAILVFRYFLFAGGFYWWWWKRAPQNTRARKIDAAVPPLAIRRREMYWSLSTSVLFAAVGAVLWRQWELGNTRIYLDVNEYGWPYLFVSFVILMLVHETYFYWTHRWMHTPPLFARVHRVHHESKNPSPWAAFSFHPWEAVIEAGVFPLFVLTIPIHPISLFSFLTIMTALSVVNHLGYEIYPKGLARHRLGKWIITATHHYLHHTKVRGNYGLYFTFWDRWMKTEDQRYPDLYDEVTKRAA